ncbi:zinc-ribbon domain-containing protein [Ligilactobacillus animalis]|uniref:Zinc-ribbon domain-containing protein n=1 Tax=Ligilactobacillus animalis TaxID=1605 RepID=A0AAJ6FXQ2_9LACO|nr:zinc-ribbon domain-containing protein [Ligilactobacillus animalis]WHQ79901.1 zinc-ribbon domain-containing protein [Ligilactobacillus animalis]
MENKFCSNCGQQLEAGAKFCPQCGATQNVAPSNQGQTVNQQPQTPPVQPKPQSYQQAPQQPNMQQGYQQQVPPTGQQPYQQQVPPTGQYQQMPPQPGMQERVKEDLNRFKNQVPGQAGAQPELGFIDSMKYCLANIFDFMTPESRKSVFWWNFLGAALIMTIGIVIMFIPIVGVLVYSIAQVGLWIGIYAAAARRMRYIGKSPWLIIVPFYRVYLLIIDKPQPYMGQPMYQQPNQMQQPYQQQNYGQQPQYMNQQQAPQQLVQNQHQPQQVPSQKPNDDQN